ncbi:MAG: DUF1566 domain-containing protein [Gammaproteobacteria bacterium]|nr:DUF1566 domain-containing protein [Gammaproteobacteria bacterium]
MKKIQLISLFVLLAFCSSVFAAVCQDDIPETAPESAFDDHENGLVTDKRTGLIWRKCTEGQSGETCSEGVRGDSFFTWQEALQHVKAVNANSGDGYSDWRLPNKKELETIIENSCVAPSSNEKLYLFPSRSFYADARYWTSTTSASDPSAAWVVLFQYGGIITAKKDSRFFIRLVRGGQ